MNIKSFMELWNDAVRYGPASGLPGHSDSYSAAVWYHKGMADMAVLFAAGDGPLIAKLEEIRAELAKHRPWTEIIK
jgi:hypothetical protein